MRRRAFLSLLSTLPALPYVGFPTSVEWTADTWVRFRYEDGDCFTEGTCPYEWFKSSHYMMADYSLTRLERVVG